MFNYRLVQLSPKQMLENLHLVFVLPQIQVNIPKKVRIQLRMIAYGLVVEMVQFSNLRGALMLKLILQEYLPWNLVPFVKCVITQ